MHSSIIQRQAQNSIVEQRVADGFINGTAMCVAYGKEIKEWISNRNTLELVIALADSLGMKPAQIKQGNSPVSSITRLSAIYPDLILSKRGAPQNGGGTWLPSLISINQK